MVGVKPVFKAAKITTSNYRSFTSQISKTFESIMRDENLGKIFSSNQKYT